MEMESTQIVENTTYVEPIMQLDALSIVGDTATVYSEERKGSNPSGGSGGGTIW